MALRLMCYLRCILLHLFYFGNATNFGLIVCSLPLMVQFGAKEVGDGKHGRLNWMPVEFVALV